MAPGPLINATFGPYVLRELVGAGGIAEVFRAQHREDVNSVVAVKVMRPDRQADKQHLAAFKAEYELLGKLKCRGIPRTFRIGEINGRLAMAIEYFTGTPLHLMKESIEKRDIESVFLQLTEIVGHLHENNIVHNDLKLENVILQEDSTVALVDYGNAREKNTGFFGKLFRKKEQPFGTASYIAPELIAGGSPTYRSDLYSLGVCCFMLLSGEAPFDNTRKSDRLRAAVKDKPPSIGDRVPGLSPQFIKLVDSCLSKNPEQRALDGAQLFSALSAVVKSRHGTGIYSRAKAKAIKIDEIPRAD